MNNKFIIFPSVLILFFCVQFITNPSIFVSIGFVASVVLLTVCLSISNNNRESDLTQFKLEHTEKLDEMEKTIKFMEDKVSSLALGKTITGRSRR